MPAGGPGVDRAAAIDADAREPGGACPGLSLPGFGQSFLVLSTLLCFRFVWSCLDVLSIGLGCVGWALALLRLRLAWLGYWHLCGARVRSHTAALSTVVRTL